jgi:Immunity protein 53
MAKDNSSASLERLQAWYHSNCDGNWEHQYGFRLETLDNPGWCITVDLDDTHQENQAFTAINTKDDGRLDWINLRRDGSKLRGACGPTQLGAMLDIVSVWLRPRSS